MIELDEGKIQQILEGRIEDHEERLRKLEINSVEVKYELVNLGKAQAEMKSLFLEQNKEYIKYLDKFWEQISGFLNINKQEDKQKNNFLSLLFEKYEKLTITIILILSALAGLKLSGFDIAKFLIN